MSRRNRFDYLMTELGLFPDYYESDKDLRSLLTQTSDWMGRTREGLRWRAERRRLAKRAHQLAEKLWDLAKSMPGNQTYLVAKFRSGVNEHRIFIEQSTVTDSINSPTADTQWGSPSSVASAYYTNAGLACFIDQVSIFINKYKTKSGA